MKCGDCSHWITQHKTIYADGSEVINEQTLPGKGRCEHLNQETVEDFGCTAFIAGDHVVVAYKDGAPWTNWHLIACPDCDGKGSRNDRACRRCSGTAKVRCYDDGYVADATWDHPREKELKKRSPRPQLDPGLSLAPLPRGDRFNAIVKMDNVTYSPDIEKIDSVDSN